MNIQDLGSLGELIAAIATLATLVYLALQIRQNTRAVSSQSRRQVVEGVARDTERFLQYQQDVVDLDMDNLPEATLSRISAIVLIMLCNIEILFYELREGTLDEQFRDTLNYRLYTMFINGTEFYEINRGYLTKNFQEYVDAQLEAGLMETYAGTPAWAPRGKE